MKLKVNQDACIGCGACFQFEDVFGPNEDGQSEVKVDVIPEDKVAEATEALESCPTGAIEEVKADAVPEDKAA